MRNWGEVSLMTKRIEITLEGVTVVARLLEDQAPQTVARFWEALPIEDTLRHVRWSGMAGYILASSLADPAFPFENRVSFYPAKTIALRPEHGELAFSYGQAQARYVDGNGWATHFATLEGDAEPFLAIVAATKRQGGKPLTIRRQEG
jgi:hypothetical protein